jgi:Fe-S-cluster containining protein
MDSIAQQETVDAGPFGAWLAQALRVLRGEAEADVPCGSCTGCCTSAYYIRIRPRDRVAVAGISRAYFVRAEGMSPDETLMGWRHDGTCPALESGCCTIYEQRPTTCRDYDCRVFVPAGLEAGDERKAVINARVNAWRFTFEDEAARRAFDAIGQAAAFIQEKRSAFPNEGRGVPTAPTGIAVLALKSHPVFLDANADRDAATIAASIVAASREFDL